MQTQTSFKPVYEIGFVLQKIQDNQLSPDLAALSSQNFRMMAQCILMVLQDSINHPVDSIANHFVHNFVIEASNGLIEAADLLDAIFEENK